ncbi:hypothetical protein ACIPK5_30610 [Streptomyces sp. NPDC086843]|uniref:hypothetical protein n=1 Tax=Streptomyces sp. NPDC086843 TaxID=3365763 RepID=UPI0037F5D509
MSTPELLQRYADAARPAWACPSHRHPGGTVTAASCPQCQEAVTGYDWDRGDTTVALLTLTGCGHTTFRRGQTIAVMRTAAV